MSSAAPDPTASVKFPSLCQVLTSTVNEALRTIAKIELELKTATGPEKTLLELELERLQNELPGLLAARDHACALPIQPLGPIRP